MRVLVWLARAFIFFSLFAFALNNQHEVVVHGFFGVEGRAPMVIVVLVAFGVGAALGIVAMLPGMWRRRQAPPPAAAPTSPPASVLPASGFGPDTRQRAGL